MGALALAADFLPARLVDANLGRAFHRHDANRDLDAVFTDVLDYVSA